MATLLTKFKCERCQRVGPSLRVTKKKNGEISVKANNCSVCRMGYGIHGLRNLEEVKD